MVNIPNRLMNENAYNHPFLLYLKNGKVLKCRVIDKKKTLVTMFFVLYKNAEENSSCLMLKPLIPATYCQNTLLRSTDSKVSVNNNCIMGIQYLPDTEVADVVIEHHCYNEQICGKFTIPEDYSETIVWKANDSGIISNLMEIVFEEGDKDFLEAKVHFQNGTTKTYRLCKNVPTDINILDGQSVDIIKKDASTKASGRFTVKLKGDFIRQVIL